MWIWLWRWYALYTWVVSSTGSAAPIPSIHLTSPNRQIQLEVKLPDPGTRELPEWSARFRGSAVLRNCELGIQTAERGNVLSGARRVRTQTREQNELVRIPFGKASEARDRFKELRLSFASPNDVLTDVIFRCYDDAIAVRYELQGAKGVGQQLTVLDELTSFELQGNPTAHVQFLENYQTSHEHEVVSEPLAAIPPGVLLDTPLTLVWPDGMVASIAEAALRRYAGLSLSKRTNQLDRMTLASRLTPRADGSKVVRPLPMTTPWRVVLLANRLGALLESTTIHCLNEPSVIGDPGWISPGKITFHWWNGDVYDGVPGLPMLSTEMNRKYIDFCARSGIPTHSITSTEGVTTPWYYQTSEGVAPGPDTDVTRPRPGFDLDQIRSHARSQNVKLWTWVHQAALRGRVEEAFAAFERMGWSGMMVDFFDHDDQEHVEFAEEILAAAARHHVLIQLHGIWKPTGLERTYPNLVNHEGALNFEYLKWSDRCTPEHTLRMLYTRMIAGPMDYHLGGFRAVPRELFKPRQVAPNVLGTRCHQLALYVALDNPNPMLADFPTAYEGQPGFDFLTSVPTWWDETRGLAGEIGAFHVCARRKGADWYMGGLSASLPRDFKVPLRFLGRGRYRLHLWADVPGKDHDPNLLQEQTRWVRSGDVLSVSTVRDGGWVAHLQGVAE